MLKILGTSRVDDFNRVVLENGVMDALDITPGDSVLLYRRENESGVGLYKSEGAVTTDERDCPRRNHLNGLPVAFRAALAVCLVLATAATAFAAAAFSDLSDSLFIAAVIMWAVTAALTVSAISLSKTVDRYYESQGFATAGNPYVRDRQVGFSKLTGDGYIYSGEIYINSLFGSNPFEVEVNLSLKDGRTLPILTVCSKSVPGYSVYKFRFKETSLCDGRFDVTISYQFSGKKAVLDAKFDLIIDDSGKTVISDGPIDAEMIFDPQDVPASEEVRTEESGA